MELELKLREVLPLALMREADSDTIRGKTKITKLVFLAEEEFLKKRDYSLEETVTFKFFPYDYGPFSKELLECLERLDDEGVIDISTTSTFRNTRYDYQITEAAKEGLRTLEKNDMRVRTLCDVAKAVMDEYGSMRIRKLLDYVYDNHGEYTKNSVYV